MLSAIISTAQTAPVAVLRGVVLWKPGLREVVEALLTIAEERKCSTVDDLLGCLTGKDLVEHPVITSKLQELITTVTATTGQQVADTTGPGTLQVVRCPLCGGFHETNV